ncbi:hypothetical protein GPECTOR_7g1299 [Gonium pectorale]|uniref:OTU domain-containing protein n=1 Tax=Gonium pectorale TaxID=33097 RepID=A0A150GUH8_GONPE|nr:hypothetical protein GPECTOR_7g1299 [Gonium pectorale]|eukprot:KXZ53403.1 hypothetical protein GPECTOR_7g1299 [Gonium pectorale]
MPPGSLGFPRYQLSAQPSSRELTLNRTLSRAPSMRVQPHTLASSLPPPEPAVSEDRQRLLGTLGLYELVEKQVAGDGNCQFRALSDQLYGTPEHHAAVRSLVVSTLRDHPDQYRCYVSDKPYDVYCADMGRSGTWGDHVTLKAAADAYGIKIVVVASFANSPVINIEPERQTNSRTLFLSFWAEVHYNSLYPKQEPPGSAQQAPAPAGTGGGGGGGKDAGGKPPKVLGSSRLGKLVHGVAAGVKPR